MAAPTVIVVDDDDELRAVLADVLEQHGYYVRATATGEEGLAAIRELQDSAPVVLLDMLMPGVSGADVLRCLREEGVLPALPVVVLSVSKPSFADVAGARMCLNKPIDVDVLLRVIGRLAPNACVVATPSRVGRRPAAG